MSMVRAALCGAAAAIALVALGSSGVRAQTRSGSAAAGHDDRSLLARVQRIEDADEIRTLLLDYGRFLDARDFAAYSRLFTKDGEWVGGMGTVQGPAAIQALMPPRYQMTLA